MQPHSITFNWEGGDKTIPGDIGIIVKVHKSYENPDSKVFYWVKWTDDRRSYIHFDHELELVVQRGEEK